MAKQTCPHGSILPRGMYCDRGFLIIRLKTDQGSFNKGCGPHTPSMERAARLILDDIRIKQKLGKFNIPSQAKRLKFWQAIKIYHQKHFIEYRDPKTNKPRAKASQVNTWSHLKALDSFFHDFYIDAITLKDIIAQRKYRLEYDGSANATVNKDKGILSSLFNMFRYWVEAGIVDPVKLPVNKDGAAHNPCELLPDLVEEPRVITYDYKDALKKLYDACKVIDPPMWAIIETELDTTLRKNDLQKYFTVEQKEGFVTLTQSKTGTKVTLPNLRDTRPDWAKLFINFDSRWEKIRDYAGYPQMWFRDLRKIGMQMLEELGFDPKDIALTAGHSSSVITNKWYLTGKFQADKNRPLIEARREMLEKIKNGL